MQPQTPQSHQQRPRHPHQQPCQHPLPNPHPHQHSPEAMTAARARGHPAVHDFIDLTVSPSPSSSSSGSAGFSDDVCFICLDGEGVTRAPCACPMLVHARCMARWQLQCAGSREEKWCRFCDMQLPDWKAALAPPLGPTPPQQPQQPGPHDALPAAADPGSPGPSDSDGVETDPIMVVTLGDEVHRLHVRPGPEGMLEFQARVRSLFGIPDDVEIEVTFRCKAPTVADAAEPSGDALDTISLEGMDSYEAATHCASLMAARRIAMGQPAFA